MFLDSKIKSPHGLTTVFPGRNLPIGEEVVIGPKNRSLVAVRGFFKRGEPGHFNSVAISAIAKEVGVTTEGLTRKELRLLVETYLNRLPEATFAIGRDLFKMSRKIYFNNERDARVGYAELLKNKGRDLLPSQICPTEKTKKTDWRDVKREVLFKTLPTVQILESQALLGEYRFKTHLRYEGAESDLVAQVCLNKEGSVYSVQFSLLSKKSLEARFTVAEYLENHRPEPGMSSLTDRQLLAYPKEASIDSLNSLDDLEGRFCARTMSLLLEEEVFLLGRYIKIDMRKFFGADSNKISRMQSAINQVNSSGETAIPLGDAAYDGFRVIIRPESPYSRARIKMQDGFLYLIDNSTTPRSAGQKIEVLFTFATNLDSEIEEVIVPTNNIIERFFLSPEV
jgi:hypothetical protein